LEPVSAVERQPGAVRDVQKANAAGRALGLRRNGAAVVGSGRRGRLLTRGGRSSWIALIWRRRVVAVVGRIAVGVVRIVRVRISVVRVADVRIRVEEAANHEA